MAINIGDVERSDKKITCLPSGMLALSNNLPIRVVMGITAWYVVEL